LISFTAQWQNSLPSQPGVLCNWNTAIEENTSNFVIERSGSGSGFVPVGQVAAIGNSSTLQRYSFTDKTPLPGISYYRLKSIDLDGQFTYSRIVAVASLLTATKLMIYPNPAKEEVTVAVSLNNQQKGSFSIYDQAGRQLILTTLTMNEGINTISLPVRSLPAGIYILQLKTETGIQQTQFVKQ
jgi:hypothetical protein